MNARAPLDGRHARAVRTRDSIVAAVLDLVNETSSAPTGPQIAERAGVALRSIGQHFRSREDLLLAAAEVHMAGVAAARPPVDPSLPLPERMRAFCSARAKELEATAAVRRASVRFEASSPAVAAAFTAAARARRAATARVFADVARGPEAVDLLDAATSARTWDIFRRDHAHSITLAERRMFSLLSSILASLVLPP